VKPRTSDTCHRRRDVGEVAGQLHLDGRAGPVLACQPGQIGDARARRQLGREAGIAAAQHADHAPHLGQGARRLGLDHAQRLSRGVRPRRGRGQARLGADRDGRDMVRHRVVQVTRQPLTLEQLDPIELPQPGTGPVPERRPQGHRQEQEGRPGHHVGGAAHAGQGRQAHLAQDERRADHGLAP